MPITETSRLAQTTPVLVRALQMLEREDFTRRMGSGVVVRLTDLEGKTIGGLIDPEFMLAAEDMQEIKVGMISSLRKSLRLRRMSLVAEIGGIDGAVPPETDD